jgi:hypothetical protein
VGIGAVDGKDEAEADIWFASSGCDLNRDKIFLNMGKLRSIVVWVSHIHYVYFYYLCRIKRGKNKGKRAKNPLFN